MTSNPQDSKQTPSGTAETVTSQPSPQWELAAFLPLPFLVGCVYCFWHAYRIGAAAKAAVNPNPSNEIEAGFLFVFGVFALVLYVVAVVLLGFFGHALGMKIYPVRKNDD
jgi:hypothetical protein